MKTKKQIKEEIASLEQKLEQAKKELNTPEFEIGKWYKSNMGSNDKSYYYLKVTKNEGDFTVKGEKITTERSYRESDYWDSKQTIEQALEIGPMTNLSEIQQYLPDGHPDKKYIPKKGEYYYQSSSTWDYGYISIYGNNEAINTEGTYLRDFAYQDCDKNRPATKEEKQWLDACIKAGKFISKDEALETEEERLLKEAKKRYPVGTTITPFNSSRMIGNPTQVTVDKDDHRFYMGYIWVHTGKWSAIIYRDGEWAEIIPEVKKWDVGTYIVFIKNFGRSKVGNIDKITDSNFGTNGCLCEKELITTKDEEYVKWFATKEEAEEFAKTLIPQLSVGDYFVSERYNKHIGRITEIYNDETRYRYWGYGVGGPFRENDWYGFSDTKPRKATDKEIKEFLSNVAKYKYPSGVWVDQAVAYPGSSKEKLQIKGTDVNVSLYSAENFINVSIGGVGVFNTKYNIWAPIISAPSIDLPFGELTFTIDRNAKTAKCKFGTITKEEIEKVLEWAYPSIEMLGYPLTLEDNTIIHFGCQKGSIKEAQAILDAFE